MRKYLSKDSVSNPIELPYNWTGAPGQWQIPDGCTLSDEPILAPAPSVAALVVAIKAECERRILAVLPHWKQHNATARGTELVRKIAEGSTWTAEEQAEADAIDAAWAWVKSARSASDDLEAAVATMTDEERRAVNIADDVHWPASL